MIQALAAAALAALVAVAVAAAGGGALRVGLTATGTNGLDVGVKTKLTASARLPKGARLLIQAFPDSGIAAKLIECAKSPCVASYRSTEEQVVRFRASAVRHVGKKVLTLGRSAPVSVFWLEPPPTPPPPPAAVPGHYEGHTQDNEIFSFDVSADGLQITGLQTGQINQSCYPPDYYISAGNLRDWSGPVARDGTFTFVAEGPTTVDGEPAMSKVKITGRVAEGTASGTVRVDLTWPHGGTTYACTNGDQTWSAAKV
jgi:hypothetical protein